MIPKIKINTSLKNKLAIVLLLSSILVCLGANSFVKADGFYFIDPSEYEARKAPSPIVLDTSNLEKITPRTTIPYKLRQFDESDYFSSSIDDAPQMDSNSSKVNKLMSLPSPSEYKTVKNIQENYTPTTTATNFFSPIPNSEQEAEKNEVAVSNLIEKDELAPAEEISYFASATTEEGDNSDYEGYQITSLKVKGLKSLNEQEVLGYIDTEEGSLFNSDILQRDLQKLYSTGYFTDEMSVEPTLLDDETIELVFSVEENPIVADVSVVGNTVIATNELMPFVMGMKNKPQNLNSINRAVDSITSLYNEKGYILASVASVDDDADGNLNFVLQEGVINEIKISGNEKTKDYVIRRNIITQPGTVYNEEFLKKDLSTVFSTQIFEEVNREIAPSEANDGTFDVIVVVKEKSTDSIALGGGIDTGLGAFGSLSFREDNFLGKAQRMSLTGIIGSGILLNDASIKNHMNYQVELSFFEPHFINSDNSLMSKLYFRELGSFNVPLAIERRIGAMTGIEHKVKDHENLSTTFMLGAEHVKMKEGDFDKISRLYNFHNLSMSERAKQLSDGFFLNLAPGIKYCNLDDKELPREGIYAQAQFTESLGVSYFNQTSGRLSGMVTRFFPVFKKSTFSLTGKAGIKVHGDHMPEYMAYRLGGPYTIRGYRMSGVGTGESFLMGSAELATPLPLVERLKWDFVKRIRLTFFIDAGKVFNPTVTNILYDRPEHAITAGIGLRFHIPGLGPISIDYGLPLTNPGSYGSEHGYFTFGTGGLNGIYGY